MPPRRASTRDDCLELLEFPTVNSNIDIHRMDESRRHLQLLHLGKLDVYGLSSMPLQRLHDTLAAIICYQMPTLAMYSGDPRGIDPVMMRGQPATPSNLPSANASYQDAIAVILQTATPHKDILSQEAMHQAMHCLDVTCRDPPGWLREVMFTLMKPATQDAFEKSEGLPWRSWLEYICDRHAVHAKIEDIFNQAVDPPVLWGEMKAILRALRTSNCFAGWDEMVRVWIHLSICRQMAMCLETPNFRQVERVFFREYQVVFRATEAGQIAPDWQREMARRYPGRVRLAYDGTVLPLERIVYISTCNSFVVHQDDQC